MPHEHGCEGKKVWDRTKSKCVVVRKGDILELTDKDTIRKETMNVGFITRIEPFELKKGDKIKVDGRLQNDMFVSRIQPKPEVTGLVIKKDWQKYMKFAYERVGRK